MNPYWPNAKVLAAVPPLVFPSTGTVMVATKVHLPSGQVITSYLPSEDPDLVNAPCRRSPLILQRPVSGEDDGQITILGIAQEMVAFNKHLPEIKLTDRFVTDGLEFDIKNVEHDGNKTYTRIRLERRS
jgi:hypothetical protein